MRKFIIAALLFTLIATAGCGVNLLEGSVESVTAHESTPYVRPPAEQITISDISGFHDILLGQIEAHEGSRSLQYQGVDFDDLQAEIMRIAGGILSSNTVAAYAVSDISVTAARIVAYYEVGIEIQYRRTAEQISSIREWSTPRDMMTQLLDAMSQYREEAIFLTGMQLEKEEIESQIAEIYYQNPSRIVMMPFVTIDVFPEDTEGTDNKENTENAAEADRIYEIRFGYTEDTEMLRSMGENLGTSVRRNAARAEGDTDGARLLSLAGNLIASVVYDEGAARTIAMHGPQNFMATAFGALVRGSAVGEGFAMAFKALCDELRLECSVVPGRLDDRFHAWNIVQLDGYYYHIDTAMCALYGLEAGFLKTDADISELYAWDTGNTPRCSGPLTLEDLLPPDIPDDLDGTDDPDGTDAINDPDGINDTDDVSGGEE